MTPVELLILRSLKIGIVVLGSILVYLAITAYRRNGQREFLFLSVGFGLITVGSVSAGILFEFLGFELLTVNIVESIMIILGFLSLVYSIYR